SSGPAAFNEFNSSSGPFTPRSICNQRLQQQFSAASSNSAVQSIGSSLQQLAPFLEKPINKEQLLSGP
ncbi:hypothetical protein Dimus_008532, partial [Dionaea muscipula]